MKSEIDCRRNNLRRFVSKCGSFRQSMNEIKIEKIYPAGYYVLQSFVGLDPYLIAPNLEYSLPQKRSLFTKKREIWMIPEEHSP